MGKYFNHAHIGRRREGEHNIVWFCTEREGLKLMCDSNSWLTAPLWGRGGDSVIVPTGGDEVGTGWGRGGDLVPIRPHRGAYNHEFESHIIEMITFSDSGSSNSQK